MKKDFDLEDFKNDLATKNKLRELEFKLLRDPPFKCRVCDHDHCKPVIEPATTFGSAGQIVGWCCAGCSVQFNTIDSFSVLTDKDTWLKDHGYGELVNDSKD